MKTSNTTDALYNGQCLKSDSGHFPNSEKKKNIVIRVRWSWGDSKLIKTNPCLTISDVLAQEGFSEVGQPGSQQLLFVYKGKILDGNFSFDYHKIKTGSTIICHLKNVKAHSNEKKMRFLESLKAKNNYSNIFSQNELFQADFNIKTRYYEYLKNREIENEKYSNILDEARRSEISRLNDLAFSAWETMPEYPNILKEMLKNEEEEEAKLAQKSISIHKNGLIHKNEITQNFNFRNNNHNSQNNNNWFYEKYNSSDNNEFADTQIYPFLQYFDNGFIVNEAFTGYHESADGPSEEPLPNPFYKQSFPSGVAALLKPLGDINIGRADRKEHFPSQLFKDVKKSE
ncbi:hypothetical protein TRFO_36547 [Tritrichomonas foetus]|uniref:Ubiquitin-like domain-containing protein n=1 Tax=Tritrichomonas foetus TaxID=1144522 RepID=A0A1J4JID1_9EUKA|nr:hypothetical protein TRFO_36547 [Tritrichomonas foetus]|eukprot:OHS97307.1 hypothetical protein TRFO_36547 [Tritrichomonas foetus]